MQDLTPSQLNSISVIERACSVLSLIGCLFIIVTFCSSHVFHKPINRLVFYASFGNMMTNVGTLMSRVYLRDLDSFGCQFQAFLIQMFMPADAFWTLAMAINVYLTFYRKFDAEQLRRMELAYLACCYGLPLIPAFVYVFVRNGSGDRVYGNATLWCWISPHYDILRIATFYGPVWVTILITFFIYIRAGRTIYEKRKQLHDFKSSEPDPLSINGEAVATIKRTEVTVTTEAAGDSKDIQMGPIGRGRRPQPSANGAYSVHISADHYGAPSPTDSEALPPLPASQRQTIQQTSTMHVAPHKPPNPARRRNHELNNAAWSYTKCAILFFTAILITWIPSTANRVYSVVHRNDSYPLLEFMSAFVLPLQGFWNAVIYAVTSWSACRNFLHDVRIGRPSPVSEITMGGSTLRGPEQTRSLGGGGAGGAGGGGGLFRPHAPRSTRTLESESTAELAKPRAGSAGGDDMC